MIDDVLFFTVPGEPVPKGRARSRAIVSRISGKVFATHYTPASTRAYEAKVRLLCQAAINKTRWVPSENARFEVTISVTRKYEGKGGDIDNYAKAIMDAINKVAFPDDRYVRALTVRLWQGEPDVKVMIVEACP